MNAPHRIPNSFWAAFGFSILLVFSAANLFVLIFAVPKFGVIYQDALPGKALPVVTEFILAGRFLIALVNVAWLILYVYLARQRNRHSILALNLATTWNFLQVWATLAALMMPMVGTITGMSVASCR